MSRSLWGGGQEERLETAARWAPGGLKAVCQQWEPLKVLSREVIWFEHRLPRKGSLQGDWVRGGSPLPFPLRGSRSVPGTRGW